MEDESLKSSIDRAYAFCEEQQLALDEERISEAQWFDNYKEFIARHYLMADNPRAQSGHGGNERRYRYTQEMILKAIDKPGSFIDVGCANGHLMEKLDQWLQAQGLNLEFYGLDISEGLIELAKRRLPQWQERFFVGNALYWNPNWRFDYVCVRELGYVPRTHRREFFFHLFNDYVVKGGRLILGPQTEFRDNAGMRKEIAAWGIEASGTVEKSHQEHAQLVRRLYWFER
jgi:SAM-dependent methyltransferase